MRGTSDLLGDSAAHSAWMSGPDNSEFYGLKCDQRLWAMRPVIV
jgi:hypothetical protein